MKILQFTAAWCGPCKTMKPMMQEFASEMGDKIDLTVIDVETNSELTVKYNIRNIPAFIFIHNEVEVDRLVGAHPISKFKEIVTAYESKN